MLQDKAKIKIELDVASAKKQEGDIKKSLSDNTKLETRKIEKTKEDIKKESKKEIDRQRNSLSDKLKRAAQLPARLIAPDLPERLIGLTPVVGGSAAFFFRNRDIIEALVDQFPKIKKVIAAAEVAAEFSGVPIDAKSVREFKAEWESVSKTIQDTASAFTGAIIAGQIPSADGSSRFITNLYEYNSAMSLLNKNRRFHQFESIAKHIPEILSKGIQGIGGGRY